MAGRHTDHASGDSEEERIVAETRTVRHEGSAEGDVVSDPALNDHVGADWVDEGGADPTGPATSTRAADEEPTETPHPVKENTSPNVTLDPSD